MNTPEGPTFCGGCPMQGYCLEPTVENFTVEPVVDHLMDPAGLIKKMQAYFTDQDGFNSVPVPLDMAYEETATPNGRSYQVDALQAATWMGIKQAVAVKLLDRMARCNGNAVSTDARGGQTVVCPAVGGAVVNILFANEATKA